MMIRCVIAILLLFRLYVARAQSADEWVYLDNGTLRLGVNKTAGACVGFLSAGTDGPSVLNSFDRGRFVQQSYYGAPDGSKWVENPWRYNPVQGGDWHGKPAVVLEFRSDDTKLYAKTKPLHWATGAEIQEMTMEEWIELKGCLVRIRFRMAYSGEMEHPVHHQEIPAFFVQPELGTLVLYDGDEPWTGGELTRRQPGFPNEAAKLSEHWAAWVDRNDQGVGLYVGVADRATCYRYGNGVIRKDSCSYIAPLAEFALKPGLVWEYDAWITLGSVKEIRERFGALHADKEDSK